MVAKGNRRTVAARLHAVHPNTAANSDRVGRTQLQGIVLSSLGILFLSNSRSNDEGVNCRIFQL